MKHFAAILIWGFAVQLPALAMWGWYAGAAGVPPGIFVFSAVYMSVALGAVPWVAKWLRPQWFRDASTSGAS